MKEKKQNVFLGLCITGICFVSLFFVVDRQSSSLISPLAEAKQLLTTKKNKNSLTSVVEKAVKDINGPYAIVIKNLRTNETFFHNEHELFEPASLYKLWIMATVMEQIREGIISEDDILSESIQTLNKSFNIDPELAELTEGSISLSVQEALEQMITISHNYAAFLLGKKVRLSNVSEFLTLYDFNESKLGEPPETSAKDIARFLEMIYTNKIINKIYSEKMIELLKKQELNEKMPKYLPKNTVIAHKTGELGTFSHDAGIIFHPQGDYIFVILTDTPIPSKTEEQIAQLSKAVYEYFSYNTE